MSLLNYRYTADSGTVYQVSLPSDVAVALGYVVATGSEPYLDAAISPRFANYRSPGGITRQAVITTTILFGSLPLTISVGADTYSLISAVGEKIPPYLASFAYAPQGPMGPKGDQWTPARNFYYLGADIVLTANTWTTVFNLSTTAIGWWILAGQVCILTAANAAFVSTRFWNNTTGTLVQGLGTITLAASQWGLVPTSALLQSISATDVWHLQVLATNPGVTVKRIDQQLNTPATQFLKLQVF